MSHTTISPAKAAKQHPGNAHVPVHEGVTFELHLAPTEIVVAPPAEPSLVATLALDNRRPAPLSLMFLSGQEFDIEIRDASGKRVLLWSAGRVFDDLARTVEIKGRHTWKATLPLKGLAYSDYTATAWLTAGGPSAADPTYTATESFTIRAKPVLRGSKKG